MADRKRKVTEATDSTKHKMKYNKKQKRHFSEKTSGGGGSEKRSKRRGPRLPASMRKEVDRVNSDMNSLNGSDEDIDSDEAHDFYEYEEPLPEEESKKNRRFDPVENYEYELPEKFKDENVLSDDDNDDDEGNNDTRGSSKQIGDEVEDDDDERHSRMLQGITGMPSAAFEGKKKKKNLVVSESYPESEFNPSRDVLDGNGQITVEDLLESLQGKSGYSKLRKRMHQMHKKSTSVQAPLPRAEREKLERKVVYEQSKKDITKWEPLVKMNREAPTICFDEDTNLGFSTVGAIASGFEPRTGFEKKMASLVNDDKVMEAHQEDGSKLLELNKISVEDYLEDRNHTAKMRSLLFRHEMKKKRIKKIKSKTYHRLLKKDRLRAASTDVLMDPEAAKEEARKQEFKRAEERMTLKHKNSSKWAKRILKRGLNAQDEGTRAAVAEQLQQHALLTRKINTIKDSSSSSDDSSDEDDVNENSAVSDQDEASKLFANAKGKTLKVMEEDDEMPNSGVLSLPFMARGLRKRKEEAMQEAKMALQEYESSLKELKDSGGEENSNIGITSGRRVFGPVKREAPVVPVLNKDNKTDNYYGNNESEDDMEAEDIDFGNGMNDDMQKNIQTDSAREDSEISHDSVFKSFDDVVRDPSPKTSYDVAIFASGKWKKMKSGKEVDACIDESIKVVEPAFPKEDLEEVGEESDADSEGLMVDGILSSGPKASYELPSQEELIRLAFAGDDVEEDFEKNKQEVLNEENPVPEKPNLIPGWGQWTHIQQKKGLPSWMLDEHEIAKRKREEALKKRKDAHLKNVIISEKLDKKAEKLHTKTLPYPFTSKEVFEQSIRVPIGPEFNPATAVGALNQPDVKKKSGIIIKPIKFEEVNPHEKTEESKQSGRKQKTNKNKGNVGKRTGVKPVVVKS